MVIKAKGILIAAGILFLLPLLTVLILAMFKFDTYKWIEFWGSYMAFAGTLVLGTVALLQNLHANNISTRLLEIEELNCVPNLTMSSICENQNYIEAKEISLIVYLENKTTRVIELMSDPVLSVKSCKHDISIPASTAYTMYKCILPGETKELKFAKECEIYKIFGDDPSDFSKSVSLHCHINMEYKHLNSNKEFNQIISFAVFSYSDKKLVFSCIEYSIKEIEVIQVPE